MSTHKHTRTYSLEEAKAEIERLIEEMIRSEDQSVKIVREGERVVISANASPSIEKAGPRPHSQLKGKIWVADDFDDELPQELLY